MTLTSKERRFRELVLPHIDSAFNLARWLARDDHDAQDIVQEACLRAFRFFDGFHGNDGRPWLMGIVRNTFYTWHRQHQAQGRNTEFDEDLHGRDATGTTGAQRADDNPEAILMQKDGRRAIDRALESLAVEFREVLVMRELEDLSYKEIALIVGIPIGTVMSRLARARKQLAATLAPRDRNHDGP